MNITVIAGARPNFMKIAPVAAALRRHGACVRIVHTGQHYDTRMSQTFFDELGIPHPDTNLEVGSGSQVWQISEVMRRLEIEFTEHVPDVVVVVGDVNSTVAATITAKKLGHPVAHVEAGLRSFDRSMPEELNRILTDSVADWLFTSEPAGGENLRNEGIAKDRIHFVGNVMIDTLRCHLDRAIEMRQLDHFGLEPRSYAVLTLHRPSNVDDPDLLRAIMGAVQEISQRMPIIFPVHPRTAARIRDFGLASVAPFNGYTAVEPLGYISMLSLVEASRVVLTDSGGLQEETTALRVPCLTLRDNTERPVTLSVGSNRLVGTQPSDILSALDGVLDQPDRFGKIPEGWDGHASERIADCLLT